MVKINVDKGLFSALNKAQKMDDVRRVVLQNGTELQQKMMRASPVDTGFLRRSIGLSANRADLGLSVSVMPNAEYAPYLEYGTRYINSQPFVRPSFNKQKHIFISDLKALLK